MTVDETNKLRESLGMAPLATADNAQQQQNDKLKQAEAEHEKAENERLRKKLAAKKRERLLKVRFV